MRSRVGPQQLILYVRCNGCCHACKWYVAGRAQYDCDLLRNMLEREEPCSR